MNGQFDNDLTLAESIGHRFCITPPAVLKWMQKRGYTSKDFCKVLAETKNFENFLSEILNA